MKILSFAITFLTMAKSVFGNDMPPPQRSSSPDRLRREIPPAANTKSSSTGGTYFMPSEEEPHEGTWLQWPHNHGWDNQHVQRYQEIWIQMTEAIHTGERVHIITYNWRHTRQVRRLLRRRGLNMSQIDFWDYPTDDVWIRDNGPIFVYDQNNNLVVENWKFNGWGGKADWWYDDYIPIDIARDLDLPRIDVDMVNEGGSIEVDGKGTLMAKKSSIINNNRNPGLSQKDVEDYFKQYLGVTNFIWLNGHAGEDITDDHIDGTARFVGANTIVTMAPEDLRDGEYDILKNARNTKGELYDIVHLPLTDKTIGEKWKGLYINYYVGNDVVIVPTYDDMKDGEAIEILQVLYEPTGRRVVGINMEELYLDGGAAHCVTQQQPMATRRR